jgi:hypothetical protein
MGERARREDAKGVWHGGTSEGQRVWLPGRDRAGGDGTSRSAGGALPHGEGDGHREGDDRGCSGSVPGHSHLRLLSGGEVNPHPHDADPSVQVGSRVNR